MPALLNSRSSRPNFSFIFANNALTASGFGHIGRNRKRPVLRAAREFRCFFQRLHSPAGKADRIAILEEGERYRSADSRSRPGYDCNLPPARPSHFLVFTDPIAAHSSAPWRREPTRIDARRRPSTPPMSFNTFGHMFRMTTLAKVMGRPSDALSMAVRQEFHSNLKISKSISINGDPDSRDTRRKDGKPTRSRSCGVFEDERTGGPGNHRNADRAHHREHRSTAEGLCGNSR